MNSHIGVETVEVLTIIRLLKSVDVSSCNYQFQVLACQRITAYAALRAKAIEELTIGELSSIIKNCDHEFNFYPDPVPVSFCSESPDGTFQSPLSPFPSPSQSVADTMGSAE